jgi:hypothetical protein
MLSESPLSVRCRSQALHGSSTAAPTHAPNNLSVDDAISAHALEVGGGIEEEKPGGDMGEWRL